jgi:hypothetical protein
MAIKWSSFFIKPAASRNCSGPNTVPSIFPVVALKEWKSIVNFLQVACRVKDLLRAKYCSIFPVVTLKEW